MKLKSIHTILVFFLINLGNAFAQSIPYLNQNDKIFYDLNFIPKNQTSSLCGPSAYINFLISEKKIKSNQDGIKLIINHSNEIKKKYAINVHNGLIESDLIKFMNSVNDELGFQNDFRIYGDAFETNDSHPKILLEKLNSKSAQILLLKLEEVKVYNPFERKNRYDLDPINEEAPNFFYHFVLKTQNEKNETILIDSEDPSFEIIINAKLEMNHELRKEEIILSSQTPKAFHRFKLRSPFRIKVKSLIELN